MTRSRFQRASRADSLNPKKARHQRRSDRPSSPTSVSTNVQPRPSNSYKSAPDGGAPLRRRLPQPQQKMSSGPSACTRNLRSLALTPPRRLDGHHGAPVLVRIIWPLLRGQVNAALKYRSTLTDVNCTAFQRGHIQCDGQKIPKTHIQAPSAEKAI